MYPSELEQLARMRPKAVAKDNLQEQASSERATNGWAAKQGRTPMVVLLWAVAIFAFMAILLGSMRRAAVAAVCVFGLGALAIVVAVEAQQGKDSEDKLKSASASTAPPSAVMTDADLNATQDAPPAGLSPYLPAPATPASTQPQYSPGAPTDAAPATQQATADAIDPASDRDLFEVACAEDEMAKAPTREARAWAAAWLDETAASFVRAHGRLPTVAERKAAHKLEAAVMTAYQAQQAKPAEVASIPPAQPAAGEGPSSAQTPP